MGSLRRRAIYAGFMLVAASLSLGGIALYSSFNAIALRSFDDLLGDRQLQVVAALANQGANADSLAAALSNPSYERPYSGLYWQIVGPDGGLVASHSLFDATLPVPRDISASVRFANETGPYGAIRVAYQAVTLEGGGTWEVIVGQSLAAMEAGRRQIRQSLFAAFGLVGILGILSAFLQTSAVLRPLAKLRQDIKRRWEGEGSLNTADYPNEVLPLIEDINVLLTRNREILERTRRQGADLAHALKTPLAILRNEIDMHREQGVSTDQASHALNRIDAQILRSLARVRSENSAGAEGQQTSVRASVERLVRLFRSLPEAAQREIDLRVEPELQVAMDRQDLEEVLGNILENALKWSRGHVRVTAGATAGGALVQIEDDGPGIAEADMPEAMRPGGRLDTASNGTGLGLAIAIDIMQAYGGRLALERSASLGGLSVVLTLARRQWP